MFFEHICTFPLKFRSIFLFARSTGSLSRFESSVSRLTGITDYEKLSRMLFMQLFAIRFTLKRPMNFI